MARPRAVALAALLVLAAMVVLLAGCSSASGGGQGQFVAGNGAVTVVPVVDRGERVDLAGTTLAGDRLDLAQFRGQVVVLNVWGSWCPPCREEAPDLQAAATELADDGVQFVGVNIRDTVASGQAFERKFGVTYPSLYDDDGSLLLALRGAVPPQAIPTTLVLDPQGRVAARVSGPVTGTTTLAGLVEDARG